MLRHNLCSLQEIAALALGVFFHWKALFQDEADKAIPQKLQKFGLYIVRTPPSRKMTIESCVEFPVVKGARGGVVA